MLKICTAIAFLMWMLVTSYMCWDMYTHRPSVDKQPSIVQVATAPATGVITSNQVYWITRLDGIQNAFKTICGVSLTTLMLLIFALLIIPIPEKDQDKIKRSISYIFCLLFLAGSSSGVAALLVPTTKEAATIYLLPKLVNSEFVQKELPAESREAYGLFKEYLKAAVKK